MTTTAPTSHGLGLTTTGTGASAALSRAEAQALVAAIKGHLNEARLLLYRLYEGQGWLALGYGSWRECVTSEFGSSESELYRELAAARLEVAANIDIGTLPESHARAVHEVLGADSALAVAVVNEANRNRAATAHDYQRLSWEVWVRHNLGAEHKITHRMEGGDLAPKAAYQLARLILSAVEDGYDGLVTHAMANCSDPLLAARLPIIYDNVPRLFEEIVQTGCLPGLDEQVPLGRATLSQLNAILGVENAERRARVVEHNRSYYEAKGRAEQAIIAWARALLGRLARGENGLEPEHVEELQQLTNALDTIEEHKASWSPSTTSSAP